MAEELRTLLSVEELELLAFALMDRAKAVMSGNDSSKVRLSKALKDLTRAEHLFEIVQRRKARRDGAEV